ncbi:MAG: hypothetical protein AAGF11_33565 [Myxococcota bacterium]
MKSRVAALFGLSLACTPTFEDRPWRIDEDRIVAIAATPAEARPGTMVSLQALVVGPDGPFDPAIEWSACTRPRSARERTGVTERCARGEDLEPLGTPARVLDDACARFGPNPPPTEGDAPSRRPADPDPSGGFFLPVHAEVSAESLQSFGFVRLRCDLAGVTRAIFDQFEARYRDNLAPMLDRLELRDEDTLAPLGTTSAQVRPGASVDFELVLATEASEPYVVVDPESGQLLDRQEALTVRWYVTDGELDRGTQTLPGTELGEDEARFVVSWRAPPSDGPVFGWAVLVDDRGGTSWAAFEIDVR